MHMAKKNFDWINFLLEPLVILTNGQSALLPSKNPIHHERSKHVEVKFHFIRQKLSSCKVILEKNLCRR